MKLRNTLYTAILCALFGLFTVSCGSSDNASNTDSETTEQSAEQGKEYTSAYICPMHCEGSGSDKAGKCPVCGMDYVANEDKAGNHDQGGHDGHNH